MQARASRESLMDLLGYQVTFKADGNFESESRGLKSIRIYPKPNNDFG